MGSAMNANTRIKIFVDGEEEANLDFMLYLAHGVGFGANQQEIPGTPWGTHRMGHTGAHGGMYNTFRIPFGKSFRITATSPTYGLIWYIIRGVENYPVVLGNLILPAHTKLRLYKNVDVVLSPLEFLPLAIIQNSAGAVFFLTLKAESPALYFLEACLRAYIDGSNMTTWLSSGTEDLFLSSDYFDRGTYHQENAGLTFFNHSGQVSAYKFFENDPVLFTKSFELWWRNSDFDDRTDKLGCPQSWPDRFPHSSKTLREMIQNKQTKGKLLNVDEEKMYRYKYEDLPPVKVTTYTWVYEW